MGSVGGVCGIRVEGVSIVSSFSVGGVGVNIVTSVVWVVWML